MKNVCANVKHQSGLFQNFSLKMHPKFFIKAEGEELEAIE